MRRSAMFTFQVHKIAYLGGNQQEYRSDLWDVDAVKVSHYWDPIGRIYALRDIFLGNQVLVAQPVSANRLDWHILSWDDQVRQSHNFTA